MKLMLRSKTQITDILNILVIPFFSLMLFEMAAIKTKIIDLK
jgi:hypothetical protein